MKHNASEDNLRSEDNFRRKKVLVLAVSLLFPCAIFVLMQLADYLITLQHRGVVLSAQPSWLRFLVLHQTLLDKITGICFLCSALNPALTLGWLLRRQRATGVQSCPSGTQTLLLMTVGSLLLIIPYPLVKFLGRVYPQFLSPLGSMKPLIVDWLFPIEFLVFVFALMGCVFFSYLYLFIEFTTCLADQKRLKRCQQDA